MIKIIALSLFAYGFDLSADLSHFAKLIVQTDFTNAKIVCDGNSITVGVVGNQGGKRYTELLAESPFAVSNNITVVNKGVNGQTTRDMLKDARTDIDTELVQGVENILVVWEMTNHLYFNASLKKAQKVFEKYCRDRLDAGWKIVVVTATPRNQNSWKGKKTADELNKKILVANEWLRNNYYRFSNGLADVAIDPGLTRTNTSLNEKPNPVNYGDPVHINENGLRICVNKYIIPAIQRL